MGMNYPATCSGTALEDIRKSESLGAVLSQVHNKLCEMQQCLDNLEGTLLGLKHEPTTGVQNTPGQPPPVIATAFDIRSHALSLCGRIEHLISQIA